MNYLARVASNCDPFALCLLSSWDYRREPRCPAKLLRSFWKGGAFLLTTARLAVVLELDFGLDFLVVSHMCLLSPSWIWGP
jgi:hypothetical protein